MTSEVPLIIHISATPVVSASRLFREAKAAGTGGMSVQALGLSDSGSGETESQPSGLQIERVHIRTRALPKELPFQLLKFTEWSLRILVKLVIRRPNIIHCHSLSTLLVGVLGKWISGSRLLYDAHELETERNGLYGTRQKLARQLERRLIWFADHTIVVGPRIMSWYKKEYPGLQVSCVRNVPEIRCADSSTKNTGFDIRTAISASEEDIVLLYLGGLTPGRGIEFLCKTFSSIPDDLSKYHIVFIGYGPQISYIEDCAAGSRNIHYFPAVAPEEVVATAGSADIGICLLSSTALSYRYALPNKLFEYVSAGIPVIVNDDYPEIADFVAQFNCGWRIPLSNQALQGLMLKLTPKNIRNAKSGAAEAAIKNRWQTEATTLMRIYDDLIGRRMV